MYVKMLRIENFRGIRKMELNLDKQMNLLYGVNGAGKSSVLDVLAMVFSRSTIFSDGNIFPANPTDIRIGSDKIFVELYCDVAGSEYFESMTYSEKERFSNTISVDEETAKTTGRDYNDLRMRRKAIIENNLQLNFPVVVYYPTNRTMLDIPERIRGFQPGTNQLDALDGALLNSLDFRSFIARLRQSEQAAEKNIHGLQVDPFFVWYKSQINAVQKAIEGVIAGFSSLHIEYPLKITIEKNGIPLGLGQLSDGEKCLIALVGDLAQRLAIANPTLLNPLEGEGVVLIDEIDLHLHPQWQRDILRNLMKVFPNCQFIVSTHSPQILGEIKKEFLVCLDTIEMEIIAKSIDQETFGMSSDMILERQMDVLSRNREVQNMIDQAFAEIERGNIPKACELQKKLQEESPDIPELLRLNMRISMKKVTGK